MDPKSSFAFFNYFKVNTSHWTVVDFEKLNTIKIKFLLRDRDHLCPYFFRTPYSLRPLAFCWSFQKHPILSNTVPLVSLDVRLLLNDPKRSMTVLAFLIVRTLKNALERSGVWCSKKTVIVMEQKRYLYCMKNTYIIMTLCHYISYDHIMSVSNIFFKLEKVKPNSLISNSNLGLNGSRKLKRVCVCVCHHHLFVGSFSKYCHFS